jgi:multiple antibiotic resistance protein
MESLDAIFKIAFSLFILMDPIGNVPIFISILKDIDPKRQRAIIFRELVIALIIIVAFYFLGDILLTALGVTQDAVMISGGLILFLIAIKMIFPTENDLETHHKKEKEPLIVPLAVPLVAGPAILAAVMIYSKQESTLTSVTGIIIAWAISTLILLSSLFIKKLLGTRGIIACERLMGLILTLISVQMFLHGITFYLNNKS